MAKTNQEAPKPHLLMVPFPAQGHIIPMFKLAKLLHNRGFHITFLNTDFNHRRLLRSHGVNSLEGLIPDFDFASFPDGLSPSNDNATQDIDAIMEAIRTTLAKPFKEFVSGVLSSNVPYVTCIIVDAFMSFTFDVAKEFHIPTVQFVILGAGPILPWFSTQGLIENGLLPLREEASSKNGSLDTVVNFLPGLEGIPLKYISDMLLITDLSNAQFNHIIQVCDKSIEAASSAILFNSFDELESESMKQLSSLYSTQVLGIGPLHLLENQVTNHALYSIGANLWKEDTSCLKWLDSKPPNSVLFVSFGSIASLTAEQMVELAWGLANSKHNFLWIIRPDLVKGDGESRMLPPEFEIEIKERAFLTSWCPQEKVLKHPSIGGFLTQCGWNSMLESISSGLPVLCLPNFAEQVTNTWLCCDKLGMGFEIDCSNIRRDDVEILIKDLMSGAKSRALKENAVEWKKKAKTACSNGSSSASFENLVELLKSMHTFNN